MKPLLVEFFGLPGAGKTTVAEAVMSELRERGVCIIGRSDISRLWRGASRTERVLVASQLLLFLLRCYPAFRRNFMSIRPLSSEVVKRILRLPFPELLLRKTLLNLEGEVLLLDQATLQDIWSIAVGTDFQQMNAVSTLVGDIFAINEDVRRAFVYFEIDVSAAAKRIDGRTHGKSRFDKMGLQQIESALHTEAGRMRSLADVIYSSSWPSLTVDGRDAMHPKVASVATWIQGLI